MGWIMVAPSQLVYEAQLPNEEAATSEGPVNNARNAILSSTALLGLTNFSTKGK